MQLDTITKLLALPNFKVVKVLDQKIAFICMLIWLIPWNRSALHVAPFIVVLFIASTGSTLKISLFVAEEPFSMFPSVRSAAHVTIKSG